MPSVPLSFVLLSTPYHPFVRHLYERAFPWYERRTWQQLVRLLPQQVMQVIVAIQNEEPVGFAVYWKLNNWYFLEHLAIDPLHGSKGYGTAVMQYLLQLTGCRLLLETELSTDETSSRRINFYEKLGLQIAPFRYQQPPYRKGESPPAMHIMSVPVIADEKEFVSITTIIRRQVFEAFY